MVIQNIEDYAEYIGIETEHLKRAIYKGTACGAWIEWDEEKLMIGSIVEGSDAEFDRTFYFPVESEKIEAWFEQLEELTDEAWREANELEEENA